jgi:stage II sporulation protein GA (sporulation sigma-E factor processing peptidase)
LYLEVYPDIIFVLNFFLDFIILTILKIISRKDSRMIRRISAAAIGAFTAALTGIFPWMNVIVRILILNIGAAYLMLLMAFGRMKKADLIRQLISLYLITYSIGGLINSIYYDTNARVSLIRLGNMIYSSISWKPVIITALFLIPAVLLFRWFSRWYRGCNSETLEVELFLDGRSLVTKGLVDSGNNLYDPVFHRPVIILENRLLDELLSPEKLRNLTAVKSSIEGKNSSLEEYLPDGVELLHLRMIPYQSIGNRHGMMLGLVLDKVLIHQGVETSCNEKVTAAICDNCLSTKDEYHVILHKELLS